MSREASFYLGGLRNDILEYTNKWKRFAEGAQASYRNAYLSQSTILAKVKQTIDKRKQRDIELITFTLSLLTVGVAGPVTNRFVKRMTESGKSGAAVGELAAKIASDSLLVEWTGDVMGDVAKKATEKFVNDPILKKLTKPDANTDAFSPVGMNPEEYGNRLKEGILERSELLSDFARAFYDHMGLTFPAEGAKAIQESLRRSPFFTDAPAGIEESALTRSAKVALWIGWASARDLPYWKKLNHPINPEVWELVPIRDELVRLGVPSSQITRVNKAAGLYIGGTTSPAHSIDMEGLIRWAKSPMAAQLLFEGLPGNAKGMESARLQLQTAVPR